MYVLKKNFVFISTVLKRGRGINFKLPGTIVNVARSRCLLCPSQQDTPTGTRVHINIVRTF